MIHHCNLEAAIICLRDHRFVVQVITDENHTLSPGLFVEILSFAVGADIAIDDIDVHLGVALLQFHRLLYREGATDLTAVGPLRFS